MRFWTPLFAVASGIAACFVGVDSHEMEGLAQPSDHVQYKIRNGEMASRAVNLGGWLVAEYWMSFDSPVWIGVPPDTAFGGEYSTMQYLGREKGEQAFEAHRSTWITEDDIRQISQTGLNTVRVTTGYWIVNDVDDSQSSVTSKSYARGSLKYLDTLINVWAVRYNLAVMVSLHAHEGSQNGMDHSAPTTLWGTGWGNSPANAESSLRFATFIAHRYKDSEAFLGLNVMNEPTNPITYPQLYAYYEAAYMAIRSDNNDCIIATSPLLTNQVAGVMNDFMPCPQYTNVWHEFHAYYKWGWESLTKEQIFTESAKYASWHFDTWTGNPIYLGEWSLATPDEVPLSDQDLATFAAIQMEESEKAQAGWAFWAWRHDDEKYKTSAWSMRQLLSLGLLKIPSYAPTRLKEAGSQCRPKGPIDLAALKGETEHDTSGVSAQAARVLFKAHDASTPDSKDRLRGHLDGNKSSGGQPSSAVNLPTRFPEDGNDDLIEDSSSVYGENKDLPTVSTYPKQRSLRSHDRM